MNSKRKIIQFIAVLFMISSVWIPSTAQYLSNHQLRATSENEQLIDEQEHIETDLEEDSPMFSFTEKEIRNLTSEFFSLTVASTKEVEEVTVYLPKEASIVKASLPVGVTVEEVEENGWLFRSDELAATFIVPLIIEEEGTYEAAVGQEKITIEIDASEENNMQEELEKEYMFEKSSNNLNSAVEEEGELLNESVEEIHFSMNVGEYLEVNSNETFEVKVEVNQSIDALRIIVPKGTEFSFEDEKERVLVETYADESSLWHMKFKNKSESFSLQLSLEESGQISVEDEKGEVHSSFLYVNTGLVSKTSNIQSEANARSTVNVSTWANFRTAWNNRNRTEIIFQSTGRLSGTTSLSTRTTDVILLGSGGITDAPTLSWDSSVTITLSSYVEVVNTSLNGGHLVQREWSNIFVTRPINIRLANWTISSGHQNMPAFRGLGAIINVGTINLTRGSIENSQTITVQTLNLQTNNYSIRNTAGSRILEANTINISNGIMVWNIGNMSMTPNSGWDALRATVVNNSVTHSTDQTFNENTFQQVNTSRIRGWGFSGDSVNPPEVVTTHNLSFEASPIVGGNPSATSNELSQGSTTTITANPSDTYRFVRWEIVSGTGSSIANTSSESTTFTMGSANTTVRAVYESNDTSPVDPPEPTPDGLTLLASPANGGSPTYRFHLEALPGTDVYFFYANPNSGFRFVRWELISGTGTFYSEIMENEAQYIGPTNEPKTIRAVYEPIDYDLNLEASPIIGGSPQAESNSLMQGESTIITANPSEGYDFVRWEIVSGTESILENISSESTILTMGNSNTTVRAVYEEKQDKGPIPPLDPLDPEKEIDPENQPEIPEEQGLLSIDFVSQFTFGRQTISVQDKNYYAQPQRLLNEDGTVNEQEKRPNYVQISDRRSETDRNGWQLSVTQNSQFSTENGNELTGARMRLINQQLATAQEGIAPSMQQTEPLEIVPGYKRVLLIAQGNEGTGTWIYRFGDADTAGNSVVLEVPKGANPEAKSYSSTFTWELSMVPEN